MFMKKKFRDAEGRVIRDGTRVYFAGEFPEEQKIFDEALYKKYGVKHPREGVVFIVGDKLGFATLINGKMQATGLCWELDDERCHDLIVIDKKGLNTMKPFVLATLAVLSLIFLIGSVGAFEAENIGFGQLFIQSAIAIAVEWLSLKALSK